MATDDVLREVLDQLDKITEYEHKFGFTTVTERREVLDPLIQSVRLLIREVQRLRDLSEEDASRLASGGIEGLG